MRTTPDKFYDSGVQDWAADVTKGVSESMMEGGDPLSRSWRGVKAMVRERTKSPWRSKGTDVKQSPAFAALSTSLRFVGKQRAAEWIDRFTATQYKVKGTPTKGEKRKGGDTTDTIGEEVTGITRQLNVITGSLIRIESQIGILQAAVMDVGDDVTDIKSLIMPKDITAKGRPVGGDWNKEDRSAVGQMRFAQYNPLAPVGMEFLKVSEKKLGGGFFTRGKVTGEKLEKGFVEDAIKKASIATAALILKIQEKDKRKAELKLKNQYRDPKERKAFEANPLLVLLDTMNARFDKLEKMLKSGNLGGDTGIVDKLGDLGGLIAGLDVLLKYGSKIAKLATSFGRFFALPAVGAILATYGIYKAMDEAFSQDTNIKQTNDLMKKRGLPFEQFEENGVVKMRVKTASGEEKVYDMKELPSEYRTAYENARYRSGSAESVERVKDELSTTGFKPEPRKMTKEEAIAAEQRMGLVQPPKPITTPLISKPTTKEYPNEEDIKNNIKQREGLVLTPYLDDLDNWTVGYGHLIGRNLPPEWDRTITKKEADELFESDYAVHRKAAEKIPGFTKLNMRGKAALIDLTYNMGADWVRKKGFKEFEKAMSQPVPDVEAAARSLENSLWYDQVKSRGPKVVDDLRSGLNVQPQPSDSMIASTRPRLMPSGTDMDTDSKQIAQSSSPAATVAALQPVVFQSTQQINKPSPALPLLRLSGMSNDSTILNMADSNHALA